MVLMQGDAIMSPRTAAAARVVCIAIGLISLSKATGEKPAPESRKT